MSDTTIIVIPNWLITVFVIYAALDGIRILLGLCNKALAWMIEKKQPTTAPVSIEVNRRMTPVEIMDLPVGDWNNPILIVRAVEDFHTAKDVKQ